MDLSPPTLRIMARGIYRTVLPTGLRPRLPIHRRPLSSGVYSLFSGTQVSSHERTTIAAPPCPSSSTLDRTHFPRGNISETREVICACRLCLRGVTERTADDVLSGIVSVLVSMPIHTFWKANITTLSPGLIRSSVRLRKRRTIILIYTRNGSIKPTASWLSSLWTASPPNKCEGYGVSHSMNPQ